MVSDSVYFLDAVASPFFFGSPKFSLAFAWMLHSYWLIQSWSIIIKIKGTANLVKSPFIWWLFVIATIHCSPLMSDLQESEKNGIPDCSFHFFLFVKQWEQNLRNKRNILKWPNENLLRDSLSYISIFWFNSKCLHLYLVLNLD